LAWYEFRPYVSAAERRKQAARELAKRKKKGLPAEPVTITGKAIARTFWGKAWCDHLESHSDFASRLPRGRTYVRNGSVLHLGVAPGHVEALVQGTELYEVSVTIAPLAAPRWKGIVGACSGKIDSLVELLQGKLSDGVMRIVTDRSTGLFPAPAQIEMTCSCPDWAGMCKHIAAALYGIGARLDEQPDLLFTLRKVDHLELLSAGAGASSPARPAGERTMAQSEMASVFGIDLDMGGGVLGDEGEEVREALKAPKIAKGPKAAKAPKGPKAPQVRSVRTTAWPAAKATGGRRGAHVIESNDIFEATVDRIVALLKKRKKGLRAEEIRVELGLTAEELSLPVVEALQTGRVRKTGRARATTYFAV
jgi:uncharacterized Zn finger protein